MTWYAVKDDGVWYPQDFKPDDMTRPYEGPFGTHETTETWIEYEENRLSKQFHSRIQRAMVIGLIILTVIAVWPEG